MFPRPFAPGPGFPKGPVRVQHVYSTVVIPHIHPFHTVTVNHQRIIHKHYFPHTHSTINQFTQSNPSGPV
ncbi:CotD family spore coat protein [Bacillus sp. FJAT-18017]|uniref:CotD family spore coat protein n=1 Tax=Bacillus sp. FJAT-18017 TaxID=1705566 RepID=UPI0009E8BC01|nr:CotD family spore coat protein [Bacillus sp. FJAT-18017]